MSLEGHAFYGDLPPTASPVEEVGRYRTAEDRDLRHLGHLVVGKKRPLGESPIPYFRVLGISSGDHRRPVQAAGYYLGRDLGVGRDPRHFRHVIAYRGYVAQLERRARARAEAHAAGHYAAGSDHHEVCPRVSICLSTAAWAPEPIAMDAMTAPTPMMMPSIVNSERLMFRRRAFHAVRIRTTRLMPEPRGAWARVAVASQAPSGAFSEVGLSLTISPSLKVMTRSDQAAISVEWSRL